MVKALKVQVIDRGRQGQDTEDEGQGHDIEGQGYSSRWL